MGYYMGDYMPNRGRSMGDPGFFSFIGGLAQKAAGFLPGPAAGIGSGIAGAVSRIGLKHPKLLGGLKSIGGMAAKHPVLTAAGAAGAVGGGAMAFGSKAGAGMHAGKMRGVGGRHRRMRVTNPKALRRAIRRTQGFAKLAMRTIHIVHPKKHARFGGFRKRRRKAA